MVGGPISREDRCCQLEFVRGESVRLVGLRNRGEQAKETCEPSLLRYPRITPESMRPVWIKAFLLVVAVWLVAGGVTWWARSTKPTPERVMAYVDSHPIDGKSPSEREKVMEKVADQLNRLSYEERRELRIRRKLDQFFNRLNPQEQSRFFDLTLPEGFKQMMEALNKMDREKRKKFVNDAVADLQRDAARDLSEESREKFLHDPNTQKIIDQGLKSFYSDASAETKMDVAPIIEQMQKNLQQFR